MANIKCGERGRRRKRSDNPIVPPDGEDRAIVYGDGAAMTFEEIGQRLGISRAAAWMRYRTAMKKLRDDPDAIAVLEDAVAFRKKEMQRVTLWELIELESPADGGAA